MKKSVGSIRDVARETGFSIATISRVMNGGANVSEATQKRVREACERLDYLPNPAARALSTSRSKTVAAIIPTIEHSVFAKFVAAIERTLSAKGYSLVLAISNADSEEELEAARKLLGMGAEAFILSGADHNPELIKMFRRRHVPHVYTSVWDADDTCPTIGYDNAHLAADAVRYLADCGHKNIGVIHGPLRESDRTVERKQGAQSVAHQIDRLTFYETPLSVSGGKHAVRSILAGGQDCTALLCFSDVLALGAYFGLAEAALRVPDDISVMGFDNLDWANDAVPPLTTIDLPAIEMGQAVVEHIIQNLETGEDLHRLQLTADIVERASVKKLR